MLITLMAQCDWWTTETMFDVMINCKMAAPTEGESNSGNGDEIDGNERLKPKPTRYKWLTEHPKYVEMKSWRLGNDVQIFITMIVYLNLCEAKDWWNVEIHPCRELQVAFLTGKPKRKGDVRVILPISTDTQLSPKRLKQFLQHICVPGHPPTSPASRDEAAATLGGDTPTSLVLAITESGSTIVYYEISDGLVPPSDPLRDSADDDELEPSRRPVKQPSRKRQKTDGPATETVTDYANEERDDFMEEEL